MARAVDWNSLKLLGLEQLGQFAGRLGSPRGISLIIWRYERSRGMKARAANNPLEVDDRFSTAAVTAASFETDTLSFSWRNHARAPRPRGNYVSNLAVAASTAAMSDEEAGVMQTACHVADHPFYRTAALSMILTSSCGLPQVVKTVLLFFISAPVLGIIASHRERTSARTFPFRISQFRF